MNMTNYMELLANNQPWNLILFMGIPVALAETLVVTEFYVLYTRNLTGLVRTLNRWVGILLGFYFLVAFLYLVAVAAVPLTISGGWRGWIDVVAVLSYLSGVIPLFAIALLEIGFIFKESPPERKLMIHAMLVALFLVLGHVAMVFGMLDPSLGGGGSSSVPSHMH
jgi:hypothetical protein